MPWNGLGNYGLPPAYSPEANGAVIDATRYNGLTGDVAVGITNALNKNGENVPTANISWGGFKITSLLGGSAPGEAISWGQAATLQFAGGITLTAGDLNCVNITNTGNTVLGNAAGDTLNVGAGGIIKDASNNVGINCTPTAPLRVQSPGNNDVGLEVSRLNATTLSLLSINRAVPAYTTLRLDGSDMTFAIAGNARWTLDAATSGFIPVTNNLVPIGSAALRPSNVFSVLANHSGVVTASAGINFGAGTTLSTHAVGSFTPTVAFGGAAAGVTYGAQSGNYTRIGDMVFVQIFISLTNKGASVGVMTIAGLPFVAAAGSTMLSSSVANLALTAPGTPGAAMTGGTSTIAVGAFQDIGAFTAYTNANASNTTSFIISGWYKA